MVFGEMGWTLSKVIRGVCKIIKIQPNSFLKILPMETKIYLWGTLPAKQSIKNALANSNPLGSMS
jgi:hypothetical protein